MKHNTDRTFLRTLNALVRLMEIRDLYTVGHQQSVAELARRIGQEMGFSADRLDGLRVGAMLHDIGKVGIPSDILTKPATLTVPEYDLVKTHSEMGHSVLAEIDFSWPVADMIHQHHERLDGSGYPNALSGSDILLEARIIAVADTVDCIVSHRPYRAGLGLDKAVDIITEGAGRLFDDDVVNATRQILETEGMGRPETAWTMGRAS